MLSFNRAPCQRAYVTVDLSCLQSARYICVTLEERQPVSGQDKTGSKCPCDLLEQSPCVPQWQLKPLPHAMGG